MSVGDESLDELARWTGEELEQLHRWSDLGLLTDHHEVPLAQRVERVRLIRFAVERGYSPERLAAIGTTQGDMVGSFAEQIGVMVGEPIATFEQAALQIGIDASLVEPLHGAFGDDPFATQSDAEALRLMKTALDLGLPADVLRQMLRVYSDATYKIADAGSRLFHLYVHEEMRAEGPAGAELLAATLLRSRPLLSLIEPTVVYFSRKAWQRALREDMMLHLAEEDTAPSSTPGEFTRAILFADLASFTSLTETMGDASAAEVLARFSEIVRAAAAIGTGQVVKQIGDEFMVVFPNGRAAISCGLAIRRQVTAEFRFPALRMGAHVGSVLYREGDYVGTTVNLAARVTEAAKRNQLLITAAVQLELDGLDLQIVPIGPRALKGFSEEVELFEVRGGAGPAKLTDPVCGMELDLSSAEVQLYWEDKRVLFCSRGCLERFVQHPDRYIPPPAISP